MGDLALRRRTPNCHMIDMKGHGARPRDTNLQPWSRWEIAARHRQEYIGPSMRSRIERGDRAQPRVIGL